ncbi:AlkA N-terminal domain-containing protein [Arthrobacter tumbae]|uniref:AlkA N-terminal domain-containing protein n=1 Tax=Arthrobacter tumbae TaxID=163874 RepID=UPI00195B64A7|nr:AlkA N-terminal domain-containing protein [Arthrobacter tumbae]MBM7782792.1 AraC family transcriptional regulator of adaptative response / DNA-3-methyladenine glycosylase II [Arthrobacter tumbae]
MDFWQRYRAIESRDTRFDGQFVTAVATTKIYCRPSCPARTPKPANVSFYPTSAAAHEAGYRACKRCLPEAVPGTPAWNLRSDTAARAMRLISDGEIDRVGVPGLALRLGYSTRQLGRILHHELGAGPLALARASRAQTARTLLTATDLALSDVAFASGFNSIRQFNETVQEVYDLSPSQLRHRSRTLSHASTAADSPTSLSLTLPARMPYDDGTFSFLRARAIDGIEQGDAASYARLLRLPGGEGWFRAEPGQRGLDVSVTVEQLKDLPVLLSRIRRLFDLDADPAAIDAVLSADPAMEARVQHYPGIRLPGAVDSQEILIRAMIGQQITVAAATGILNTLSVLGEPSRLGRPGHTRLFPTAAALADGAGPLLKGPARRRSSLLAVSAALADGSLNIGVADTPGELAEKLLPLPGIGPWTVRYAAMRVLGATDIHLDNDAAVRAGFARLSGRPADARETAAWSEQFSPWRSYATMHLWRLASSKPLQRRASTGTPRKALAS